MMSGPTKLPIDSQTDNPTMNRQASLSTITSEQLLRQKNKNDAKKIARAKQRLKYWKDLIVVEEKVNEWLKRLKKNYIKPLRVNETKNVLIPIKSKDQPLLSRQHYKLLFRDLETMEKLSTQFLTELKDEDNNDKNEPDMNARILYTFCPYFVMHKTHIEKLGTFIPLIERLMQRDKFYTYVLSRCRHVMEDDLYYLLLRPVDTLLYYSKLVHKLLMNTEEYHKQFQDLKAVDIKLEDLYNSVKKAIPTYQQLLEVSKYDCRFRLGGFNALDPMRSADIEVLKIKTSEESEKKEGHESQNSNTHHQAYSSDEVVLDIPQVPMAIDINATNPEPKSMPKIVNHTNGGHHENNSQHISQESDDLMISRGEIVYDTFVKKNRRVIRSGFLLKVGGIGEKDRSYYMILFNDMLVISKVVDENLSEITNQFDPIDNYQRLAEEYRISSSAAKHRATSGGSALSNIVGRMTVRTIRADQSDMVNGYLRIKQQLPVDACFSASDMFDYTSGYDYYLDRYGETCFQIRTSIDSFIAVCKGQVQKGQWLKCFSEASVEYQQVKERMSQSSKRQLQAKPELLPAPIFQPNEFSPNCTMLDCKIKFGFMNRRHHCYYCGRLACSKCTNYTLPDRLDATLSVRVCKHCHDQYKERQSLAIKYSQDSPPPPESDIINEKRKTAKLAFKKNLQSLTEEPKLNGESITEASQKEYDEEEDLPNSRYESPKLKSNNSAFELVSPASRGSLELGEKIFKLTETSGWKNLEAMFDDYCESTGLEPTNGTMLSVRQVKEFLNEVAQPAVDAIIARQ